MERERDWEGKYHYNGLEDVESCGRSHSEWACHMNEDNSDKVSKYHHYHRPCNWVWSEDRWASDQLPTPHKIHMTVAFQCLFFFEWSCSPPCNVTRHFSLWYSFCREWWHLKDCSVLYHKFLLLIVHMI